MKKGTGDIASCNISLFMGKYSALNENSLSSHSRGSRLILGNVLALSTTICTSLSLHLTITLLSEEHERVERIAAVVTCEGLRVLGGKALEVVELCQFFADGGLAYAAKIIVDPF